MPISIVISAIKGLEYPVIKDTIVASYHIETIVNDASIIVLNAMTGQVEPLYYVDNARKKICAAKDIVADAPGFVVKVLNQETGEYGISKYIYLNVDQDKHNLGEFSSVYDAMERYPNGGIEGDYIYILGVKHFWNVNRKSWGILRDKEDNLVQMVEDFISYFTNLGWVYEGTAFPNTIPENKRNIFYIASTTGVYKYFDGIKLDPLEIVVLRKSSEGWEKDLLFKSSDILSEKGTNPVDFEVDEEAFIRIEPSTVLLDQKQHSIGKLKIFTNNMVWKIK